MTDHTEMQIPDDVMQQAVSAAGVPEDDNGWHQSSDVFRIIARAILAERERCARIAEDYKLVSNPRLSTGSEINAWWSGQEYACEFVVSKIRSVDK